MTMPFVAEETTKHGLPTWNRAQANSEIGASIRSALSTDKVPQRTASVFRVIDPKRLGATSLLRELSQELRATEPQIFPIFADPTLHLNGNGISGDIGVYQQIRDQIIKKDPDAFKKMDTINSADNIKNALLNMRAKGVLPVLLIDHWDTISDGVRDAIEWYIINSLCFDTVSKQVNAIFVLGQQEENEKAGSYGNVSQSTQPFLLSETLLE